jgi:uncharacterized membrane protein YukC
VNTGTLKGLSAPTEQTFNANTPGDTSGNKRRSEMYRVNSTVQNWIEKLRDGKEIDRPRLISDLYMLQNECLSEVTRVRNEGNAHEVKAAEYQGRTQEMKERLDSRAVALCFSILLNALLVGVVSFVLVKKS